MTSPATPEDGPFVRPVDQSAGPMTLRSAEDVLAAVRVVLGFEPHDSIVLISAGGRHPLQARLDLPGPDCSGNELESVLDQLTVQLLVALRRASARCVVLVAYTGHDRLGRRCLRGLVRRLTRADISVAEALRTDGRRWYPLDHDRSDLTVIGVPYDVDSHPFVVAAVVEGRVVHSSRDDLAAALRPQPARVAEVDAARPQPPASADWVRAQGDRHAQTGTSPSPADAARLLVTIALTDVRETVWTGADRSEASAAVRFWADLVRCAPEDLVGDAAAVLAFYSWLSGDGAQAWCAVDRALEADPEQRLAQVVGDLLEAAFPPHEWESTRQALGFAS
ncbi:DUF4192 domain-containing protein [Nocardioides sp.]|uniref:DUF4192 domain-containing protein n=1 Tax=Nocardioides sp. TaxID=35761 RepID=UPI002ED54275